MATNLYKGISFPFRFNSSGGVATSELSHTDFSRIEESIYQILFTEMKERIFKTEFGTKLKRQVFEVDGDITQIAILRHEIEKAIDTFEERVAVNDIRIYTVDEEEGKLFIELDVHIIKFMKDVTLQLSYNLT